MQALKGLVAGLGLLIVILTGALIWGLYQKSNNPDFKPLAGLFGSTSSPGAASSAAPAPAATFSTAAFSTALALPAECRIADMATTNGRLFLRIEGGPDCDRVVAVDPASGAVVGTIWSRR
jgi:hypothetical protein